MIRYSYKLYLYAVSTITLIGSTCWFVSDPSWEPGLASFTALCACIASFVGILNDQFNFGESQRISKISSGKDFELISTEVQSALFSFTDLKSNPKNDVERILIGAYGVLFRRLKLLSITSNGDLKAVSDRAEAFLKSIAFTAKADVQFCGDWKAEGARTIVQLA
ncbi:hypothetical protein [Dechloromonas sp. A34]|uniref:hypothetical protein n=1 Tax=Dechloromonas sp. A34 TaxID=447588 RepID=UPI0022499B7C|nr:hypothetical protein [Dechloromonas sp. A34]